MVLLVQLGLGSVDEWHNLPVLSSHLEEVVSQKLLRGPALVNVHLTTLGHVILGASEMQKK